MRSYWTLLRTDLRIALRDRSVIFFNYALPLIFLVAFAGLSGAQGSGSIAYITSIVIVIGIIANGVFGAGLRAVQDREQNILRRFKVTPVSPLLLLASSMGVGLLIYLPAVALILAVARVAYGLAGLPNPFSFAALLVIGLLAMRALGLIIAAVVNSAQEAQILIQFIYLPMLFLSGATFPLTLLPGWLQTVSRFIPATYLVTGFQGIFFRHESLRQHLGSVLALAVSGGLGLTLAASLFRWEKEERIRRSGKVYAAAIFLPIFAFGAWQTYTGRQAARQEALWREIRRSDTLAIVGAKILVGDGTVIDDGIVRVEQGRIAAVARRTVADEQTLAANAQRIEAAGKTLLPGLVDAHVHLGAPGGIPAAGEPPADSGADGTLRRNLAQDLYCGVTTVKSAGDATGQVLDLRDRIRRAEVLGAEVFAVGPLFTAPGGHGTEYLTRLPPGLREVLARQATRTVVDPVDARGQVDALAGRVDGIKAVLEAGTASRPFPRLDPAVLRAIVGEAHRKNLPVVVHTGDARDAQDAVDAGADGIEHGSAREPLPPALLEQMRGRHIFYDGTLAVVESLGSLARGDTAGLERSLTRQAVPATWLRGLGQFVASDAARELRSNGGDLREALRIASDNLRAAAAAGVPLAMGTDAGNLGVFHGPSMHRELQLWVAAGVDPKTALEAATRGGATLLGQQRRIGRVAAGFDANLLLIDGDPLKDVSATEHVVQVIYKGERLDRSKLLK